MKTILAYNQDSSSKKTIVHFSTSLFGLNILQPLVAKVVLPDQLLLKRINYNHAITRADKSITDNPLMHGAMYFTLHTKTTINKGIFINADLYAEHRGFSYGVYNTNNIFVYPVINLNIHDTIKFLNKGICLNSSALHLLNEKLDNGLYIYNIDLQGARLNLSYKKFLIEGAAYTDLYNGIGLKIDDLFSFKVQRKIGKGQTTGVSMSVVHNTQGLLLNDVYLNGLYNYSNDNSSIYSQIGFRTLNTKELVISYFRK